MDRLVTKEFLLSLAKLDDMDDETKKLFLHYSLLNDCDDGFNLYGFITDIHDFMMSKGEK